MFFVALVSVLIATVISVPIESKNDSPKVNFALAVDVNVPTTTQTFNCLKNAGYQTAFVRIYRSDGTYDPNGPSNLLNANSARMGIEVYIEPQQSGSKPGSQQFDEAVSYVTTHGVQIRSAWLQVTNPINWMNSPAANVAFIKSFVTQAQSKNYGFGIYTNPYDWQQITGGYTGIPNTINLWYWHVNGLGQSGVTEANFNDFVPFGSWTQPVVKQYAQQIPNVCSMTINADTYVLNKAARDASMKNTKQTEEKQVPVAGLLMMDH